jgi:hypothetical protein
VPIFIMISKHSPEKCPMHNEKVRKVIMEVMDKADRLMKKYGVRSLGSWAVLNEHTSYMVFEASSFEALLKLTWNQ